MPDVYQMYLKSNPMGRMACPKEIARTVVFLASAATSFTTGSNVIVDGALAARANF